MVLLVSLTVSGATTDTLNLTSPTITSGTVDCIVSHSSACNSPLTSNTATFGVVDPNTIERSILKWEVVRDDQANLLESGEQNIFNNSLDFNSSTENYRQTIVLYAPEKDIEVYLTMEGAAGARIWWNLTRGGTGGRSIFGLTLREKY